MISLRSIDNEFTEIGDGWPRILKALFDRNLVSSQHLFNTEIFWHFGRLINNTDMHPGNLSFAMEGDIFKLLPIYDMCSMGFAPKSSGEIPPYKFQPGPLKLVSLGKQNIESIKEMAYDFWNSIATDARITS